MNRRGFSTSTQCQACGHVIECPDCSIPMIWHSSDKVLKAVYRHAMSDRKREMAGIANAHFETLI